MSVSQARLASRTVLAEGVHLVIRQDPTGRWSGNLWPEQAITPFEAIAAHTTSAADGMGLAGVSGSLRRGLSADFVVLDRDPFSVPIEELGGVVVEQTWFAGELVHTR